jgi:hypothetical protein
MIADSRLNMQKDVGNYYVTCILCVYVGFVINNLSNSNKMHGTKPELGHDQFPHFSYNSVFTIHPIIQRYITSVVDVVPSRNTQTTDIVLCAM